MFTFPWLKWLHAAAIHRGSELPLLFGSEFLILILRYLFSSFLLSMYLLHSHCYIVSDLSWHTNAFASYFVVTKEFSFPPFKGDIKLALNLCSLMFILLFCRKAHRICVAGAYLHLLNWLYGILKLLKGKGRLFVFFFFNFAWALSAVCAIL